MRGNLSVPKLELELPLMAVHDVLQANYQVHVQDDIRLAVYRAFGDYLFHRLIEVNNTQHLIEYLLEEFLHYHHLPQGRRSDIATLMRTQFELAQQRVHGYLRSLTDHLGETGGVLEDIRLSPPKHTDTLILITVEMNAEPFEVDDIAAVAPSMYSVATPYVGALPVPYTERPAVTSYSVWDEYARAQPIPVG